VARLRVRVQPNARRAEVGSWENGVLRVRVAAPAIEGRANNALIELLSDALGVPRREISVVVGASGRDKLIEIAGLDLVEVEQRLANASR
jgi:uncharacterized protein